jgi:hypothetical protein
LKGNWERSSVRVRHVRGVPDYAVIRLDGEIIADRESTGRDIEMLKKAIAQALQP